MNDTPAPLHPHSSFPDLKLATVTVSQGAYLPMWEANGAIYHISLHLADSVPQDQLLAWKEERARIDARLKDTVNPPLATERELLVDEMRAVYNTRVEKFLNAGSFGAAGSVRKQIEDWKSISAHRINKLLNREGAVWRRDEYTHIIRTREEYADQLNYVWHNPDAAGLTTGYLREKFV